MSRRAYDDIYGASLVALIASLLGYSVDALHNKPQNLAGAQNQQAVITQTAPPVHIESWYFPEDQFRAALNEKPRAAAPDISNIFLNQEISMPPDNGLGNFIFDFYPHVYFKKNRMIQVPIRIDYVAHAYSSMAIVNPPDANDYQKIKSFLMGNSVDGIKIVPKSIAIGSQKYEIINSNLPYAIIKRYHDDATGTETVTVKYNFPVNGDFKAKNFQYWNLKIGNDAISDIADYIVKTLIEKYGQPKVHTDRINEPRDYNQSLALKNNLRILHK